MAWRELENQQFPEQLQSVSRRKGCLGRVSFSRGARRIEATQKKLFPALVEQLATAIPQLIPHIQKAIEDDANISGEILKEQFEKLVLQPLLGMESVRPATKVTVIDALDECDQENDIRVILRLLPQVQKATFLKLRFLLTSRPELPIRLGFKGIANDHQDLVLHEIPKPVIEHDIQLYLKDRFSHLREEQSFPSDWPGEETIKILVERAVPLFIAATTLYRFISDKTWDPEERLQLILADQTTYVSKMDRTYMPD